MNLAKISANGQITVPVEIRRYTEITELDETILFELVEQIEVRDTKKINGLRVCDIKVYYWLLEI